MVTALRLVRVSQGGSVLIPDFICRDVLASLVAVGAEPVFYSIGDDLQVSPSQTLPDADAFIAVNYFGFPTDLQRVRSLLASTRTPIIEDNAHGWLSAGNDGVPLGTRSEVSVTSFRKSIRLPDGACLEWRDGSNLDISVLHPPLAPRNEATSVGFALRRAAQSVDRFSPISVMSLGRRAVRTLRRLGGKASVNEHLNEEWELPAHRAIHQMSLELISRVDTAAEIRRRRELFERCLAAAAQLQVDTPTPVLAPGVSPQGFPFFGDSGDVATLVKLVRRKRLGETIPWPALPKRSPLPEHSRLRTLQLVNFLA